MSDRQQLKPLPKPAPARRARRSRKAPESRATEDEILAVLARCPWFRQLSLKELQEVRRKGTLISVPKSQMIFGTGDLTNDVYVLISGRITISTTGLNGREIGFREYIAGDGFGELAALDGKPRSANATAAADCQLFRIPASGCLDLVRTYPAVAEEVLQSLARLIRALSNRISESSVRAPIRIVTGLLRMAEDAAPTHDAIQVQIQPVPTDEELATRYDTHRESVNRVINELKRRGLISRSRSSLTVLDLAALRRYRQGLQR